VSSYHEGRRVRENFFEIKIHLIWNVIACNEYSLINWIMFYYRLPMPNLRIKLYSLINFMRILSIDFKLGGDFGKFSHGVSCACTSMCSLDCKFLYLCVCLMAKEREKDGFEIIVLLWLFNVFKRELWFDWAS
jgi:hypothetical protein